MGGHMVPDCCGSIEVVVKGVYRCDRCGTIWNCSRIIDGHPVKDLTSSTQALVAEIRLLREREREAWAKSKRRFWSG